MGPTWLEERVETPVFWELDMSGSSVMNFPHTISVMQAGHWRERAEVKTAPLVGQYRGDDISVGRGEISFCIPKVSNDA